MPHGSNGLRFLVRRCMFSLDESKICPPLWDNRGSTYGAQSLYAHDIEPLADDSKTPFTAITSDQTLSAMVEQFMSRGDPIDFSTPIENLNPKNE